jgi:hypothetical protein
MKNKLKNLSFINALICTLIPFCGQHTYASETRVKIALFIGLHASKVLRTAELSSKEFDIGEHYKLLSHFDIAKIEQI